MSRKLQKSETGQSQLFLSLFIIFLASGIVIATNSTINGSFTQTIPNFTQTVKKTFQLEVWVNTSINLELNGNIARAVLLLDNNSMLSEQEIKFYLNGSFIGSKSTDSDGKAEISLNLSYGYYVVKAVFEGNNSLYLNPSERVKIIEIGQNITPPEKNVTQPIESLNKTFLTIFTDKKKYTPNETVNVFGELVVDGKKLVLKLI
jgi:hypothetical protein